MSRILIVEDDHDLRNNLIEILENEGYNVDYAENGKVGLRKIKKNPPDLIICDVMMPEMDGYTLLDKLQNNQFTASIPFIFLTAKFGMDELRKGMQFGADDYLTKPFRIDDLIHSVQNRLKKSAMRNLNSSGENQGKKILDINDKILISAGKKAHFAVVRDLKFIRARNPYINLRFRNGENYLLRETVSEWEQKLPPKNFVRIHRAVIINTEFILKVEKFPKATFAIFLKDEPEAFITSKRYGSNFKNVFLK